MEDNAAGNIARRISDQIEWIKIWKNSQLQARQQTARWIIFRIFQAFMERTAAFETTLCQSARRAAGAILFPDGRDRRTRRMAVKRNLS